MTNFSTFFNIFSFNFTDWSNSVQLGKFYLKYTASKYAFSLLSCYKSENVPKCITLTENSHGVNTCTFTRATMFKLDCLEGDALLISVLLSTR